MTRLFQTVPSVTLPRTDVRDVDLSRHWSRLSLSRRLLNAGISLSGAKGCRQGLPFPIHMCKTRAAPVLWGCFLWHCFGVVPGRETTEDRNHGTQAL